MKRKMKPLLALLLAVLIIAGIVVLSLTSDTQKIEETLDAGNILDAGATRNNVYGQDYTLALENEHLRFFINPDTTEFKVENKTNGSEWYSSAVNRADGSPEAATVSLSYLNAQGSLVDMNVMTDAVKDGKYKIEQEADRVTVRYSLGEFSEFSMVPYALTEDRFEAILANLEDEFGQMKLIDLYYLTDIDVIEDPETKKDRLAEYPLLAKQKLYIIRDSTRDDPLAKKDIAKIFADAGYTQEDYEADSAYFRSGETAKTAPGFNLKIEYTLDGDKLHVCIPHDGIEMYKEFPMTSLTFAPYFGSPEAGTDGWYLLPDGSGSLMNFYNENTNAKIYRTTVYGKEPTLAGRENLDSDPGASLPVFGIRRNGKGVLCEITAGDAISEIVAYPGDGAEAAYAHAVFNVRSSYKTTASTGRKESYIIIQKGRYTGDIALDYHFIASDDVTLADMASVVRDSLFGETAGKVSDTLPVRLTTVGLITRRNQFLGIAYNEKIGLTEYAQTQQISDAFLDAGIRNLSVTLTGWFGDGVDHRFLSGKPAPSALLGGKSALCSLIDGLKSKNVPLYLDADVQYTAKTALFDGFSKNADTATMLDQSMGKVPVYDPASFIKKAGSVRYIHNADAQKKAIATLKDAADGYGVNGLSLRTVGFRLPADYGKPTVDRQAMAAMLAEQLGDLSAAGYAVTTQGVGAYALPYLGSAVDVPVISGGSDTTDLSVPFLPMVLSGHMDYYATPVNLEGDTQTALLRAVAAGAGISCTLTAQNADEVTGSDLYSTDYTYWSENLLPQIASVQQRLQPVAGQRIVGYEELAQGVSKTVYQDGTEVIVNFTAQPYRYGDLTVEPKDFCLRGSCS